MSKVLSHWVMALAVILVVAALTLLQIDDYMLGVDATNSLTGAGWLSEEPFSLAEVLDRLSAISPDQAPLYFLLLNQWGRLFGVEEIALARLPAVFCGLLSLALMYRLGRDAVSPLAGLFAIVILASSTFFNFYYAHVRFYPQLVLLSALVIWLYLRIAIQARAGKTRDYLALAVVCAALVSTHAFGFLIYIVCSLYHLLFVPKNRRWLLAVAAALAGVALAGPLIYSMLTIGVGFAIAGHGVRADGPAEILATWLYLTANGSPLLVGLAALGAAIGWWRGLASIRRCTQLFALLLLGIASVTVITGTLDVGLMRHLFASLPLTVLFQAAGLYALYRERKAFGALLCLWIIAGLVFAGFSDWYVYIQGRIRGYYLPPWHVISRLARPSEDSARVIAFMLPQKSMAASLVLPHSLTDYWFGSRDVEIRWVGSARWLEDHLHHYEGRRHLPWLAYQTSISDEADLAEMAATMDALGYRPCQRVSLPVSTEMAQYSWIALDCQPARLRLSDEAQSLRYDFYGAQLSPSGSWLMFAKALSGQSQAAQEELRLSHQLISDSWQNMAQVDEPLSLADGMRQIGMDVSEVPPGRYRLMAIVYNHETGERLTWRVQEAEMLNLGEVHIASP